MSKELSETCPLGEKNGQDLAQTSRKWRKKISNGESDGERKIYPSANPVSGSKYEQTYKWLYYGVSKGGYCCKLSELFSQSQSTGGKSLALTKRGILLGTHPSKKLKNMKKAYNTRMPWSTFQIIKSSQQKKMLTHYPLAPR